MGLELDVQGPDKVCCKIVVYVSFWLISDHRSGNTTACGGLVVGGGNEWETGGCGMSGWFRVEWMVVGVVIEVGMDGMVLVIDGIDDGWGGSGR